MWTLFACRTDAAMAVSSSAEDGPVVAPGAGVLGELVVPLPPQPAITIAAHAAAPAAIALADLPMTGDPRCCDVTTCGESNVRARRRTPASRLNPRADVLLGAPYPV